MKQIVVIICGFVIIISLFLGIWYIGRKIHYSLAYKNMVEETVRQMVKPEALRGN